MNDKIQKLQIYAEKLKQRLSSTVPEKHKHRPEIFKEILRIDLKKTEQRIEKLR
jgi:hypothetical protein